MTRFGLIGAAGYVAPRHLGAIKAVGGDLAAAIDPHDSVGVMDRYFPDAEFFTDEHRFERYLERESAAGTPLDYISICSPNYMHDSHIRMALRAGAHAICEKPLTISPWNLDGLEETERFTGRRVYTVLQLRLHPAVAKLKESLQSGSDEVSLIYTTPRGRWYHRSWKGDPERSGGLVMNIGIHLLDLVLWLFGPVTQIGLVDVSPTKMIGTLHHERASVNWLLDIESREAARRSLTIDGVEHAFTEGFSDLHTQLYHRTMAGKGFGIAEARPAVELAERLKVVMSVRSG